jgi:pyruvate-ferredoxin/flavodoxin oxidoreductase
LTAQGKNPFQLDSKPPTMPVKDYLSTENRFAALTKGKTEEAAKGLEVAQQTVNTRWAFYETMAKQETKPVPPAPAAAGVAN